MKRAALFASVALFVCSAPAARASVLYASANDSPGPSTIENIYTVDHVFGSASLLGPSGAPSPLDLASDWRISSPRLWMCNSLGNQLFTLDPDTGEGTLVGGFGTTFNMQSIAFDVATGRMFGTTVIDELFEIDPETGASAFIGMVTKPNILALGFDLSGTLYGVSDSVVGGELITIKTDTAVASTIATLGVNDLFDLAARPEDGVMFAVSGDTDSLYTIDLMTGDLGLIGPHGAGVSNMVGLAFGPVPEPATLLLVVIGGLGTLRRHR